MRAATTITETGAETATAEFRCIRALHGVSWVQAARARGWTVVQDDNNGLGRDSWVIERDGIQARLWDGDDEFGGVDDQV